MYGIPVVSIEEAEKRADIVIKADYEEYLTFKFGKYRELLLQSSEKYIQ